MTEETTQLQTVNIWEEVVKYQKAITNATRETLLRVPAICIQPVLATLHDEVTTLVNSAMAQELKKLEGKAG